MYDDLKYSVNQIMTLMDQSNRVTKISVESIKNIETNINSANLKMHDFFASLDDNKMKLVNLNKTIKSLDNLYTLIKAIDNDDLGIAQGPQGSLDDYLAKLENLKSMMKYIRIENKSYTNKTLRKLNHLLNDGDRILADEFKNIIKHYSSHGTVINFMTYLINEYDQDGPNLYLPNETLSKLEKICTWFLRKEQDSELFNDKLEHCDANDKLKYTEIRFEFLTYITCYIKVNINEQNGKPLINSKHMNSSLDVRGGSNSPSLSTHSSGHHENSASSSSKHRFGGLATGLLRRKHVTSLQIPQQQSPSGSPTTDRRNIVSTLKHTDSKNCLKSLIQDENERLQTTKRTLATMTKAKALEYIEYFCENLNFYLKILKHEKSILMAIFKNSDETKHELLCKLTILIIDEIQTEFEAFLTYGVDFKQMQNNGNQVVHAIIQLVIRIEKLKENTDTLQIYDLPSAAKLIHFSQSLHEITAQILFYYLDAIKSGHCNTFSFPSDCSIHEFTQQTCEILRLLRTNESILDSTMKILCDNYIDKHAANDEQPEPVHHPRGRSAPVYTDRKMSYESEELIRRKNINFAKYYWQIVKCLNTFLIDEAIKSSTSTSFAHTSNSHGSSKSAIINLKAYVFLLNNLEYILEISKDLNLIHLFRMLNSNFDTLIDGSVRKNCEKACEIFQDIYTKWQKIARTLSEINGECGHADEVADESNHDSEHLDNLLRVGYQHRTSSHSSVNSLHSSSSNLSMATNAAKKAIQSFKHSMFKHKNSNEEFYFSEKHTHNDDHKNPVKVTNISRPSSMMSVVSNTHTDNMINDAYNAQKNLNELKKKRANIIQQLVSSIELSTKIVIINPNLNERIKLMVRKYLSPIIDSLQQSDEIYDVIGRVCPNIKNMYNSNDIKEYIFDEMFPNYKL